MSNNKGFTLIELVIVIVVLGILAVTAAPKFMDIQSDARKSVLQGAKGAVEGASNITFAKAAIAGNEKGEAEVPLDNGSIIEVFNGFPVATPDNLSKVWDTDLNAFDVSDNLDWITGTASPSITPPGETAPSKVSTVIYGAATSKDELLSSNCFLAIANNGDLLTQVIDTGC
ncbi:type II secretion system protein [Photobacterium satsumensis]|uniref:type II secretion system protein n=1 Tax=Photobacterium satsumensis TaxID=2910239 RepID=UPI003D12CBF2